MAEETFTLKRHDWAVNQYLQRQYAATVWMERVLEHKIPVRLSEAIKNGALLCELINKLRPNSIQTYHRSATSIPTIVFNISHFNKMCISLLEISERDIVLPITICNGSGMNQFVDSLRKIADAAFQKGLTTIEFQEPEVYPEFSEADRVEARRILSLPRDENRMSAIEDPAAAPVSPLLPERSMEVPTPLDAPVTSQLAPYPSPKVAYGAPLVAGPGEVIVMRRVMKHEEVVKMMVLCVLIFVMLMVNWIF